MTAAYLPVSGFRLSATSACHPPPVAATSHLEMAATTRAARGAAPTSRQITLTGLQFPFERGGTSSGLRSRLIGYQVRGFWYRYGSSGSGTGTGPNLYLVLNTLTRDLMAETWDLRMAPRSPVSP